MSIVSIITPTGDRPDCFALLEMWVAAQTADVDIEWIVVDDGDVPTECTMGQRYIRRSRSSNEPDHTLPLNMMAALDEGIEGDYLFVFEDDDYYHPTYIDFYLAMLKSCDLVGEGCARYYHFPAQKWWRLGNMNHASLAQTAMRRSMLPKLAEACKPHTQPFIDLRLWKGARRDRTSLRIHNGSSDQPALHCSLKAMPGRFNNVCIGAFPNRGRYQLDTGCEMLRRWTGPGWPQYQRLADTLATGPMTPQKQNS